MYSKVMVPVDGSAFAEQALPYAVSLARADGAALHLVMVRGGLRRMWLGSVKDTRVQVITALQPAAAIIRCAETEEADVIAVGTRGHGAAARLILGSVADKVIRASDIPVLVCSLHRTGSRHTSADTMRHGGKQHA